MLRMKKDGNLEETPDSECCSGCQSGWTLYLDHSHYSQDRSTNSSQLRPEHSAYWEEEEEEEDLSMLSDASSGPPHVHEEEDNISSCCCDDGDVCLCNATFLPITAVANNGRIKRRRAEEEQQGKQDSFLDDTASSTLFTFSKATATSSCSGKKLSMEDDHSCCFSATHFKVIVFSAFLAAFFCGYADKKVRKNCPGKATKMCTDLQDPLYGPF